MHQVEVKIVGLQVFQGLGAGEQDVSVSMPVIPGLGSQPELFPANQPAIKYFL